VSQILLAQICFAYRRWHDIGEWHRHESVQQPNRHGVDTARGIYQNATMEKIALLQLLRRRHDELHGQEAKVSKGLEVSTGASFSGDENNLLSRTCNRLEQISGPLFLLLKRKLVTFSAGSGGPWSRQVQRWWAARSTKLL